MRRATDVLLGVGVLGSLLAMGVSPALAASATVERQGATAAYNLTLDIGPLEQMLTAEQAQMQHATSGEIMAAMPGMPMNTMMSMTMMAMGNRHVEVHVTNKGTGAVAKDVMVAISLSDKATGTVSIQPIMAMYGVTQGQSDWHYGNNAQLPGGAYTATVNVNGQQATFTNLVLAADAPAAAMPAQMASGAPAQMPASMMHSAPAQLPSNTTSGSAMAMPVSTGMSNAAGHMGAATGQTPTASGAVMPSHMPLTGAGGSQSARGDLLGILIAAFGAVELLRRRISPSRH